MQELTLRAPDDWHLHLRDGEALAHVLPATFRQFRRAIIMPNLVPPVTQVSHARTYRDRIRAQIPSGVAFEPLMTLYLTEHTDPKEIKAAKECGFIHGVKLYPAGATTHSDAGVRDWQNVLPVLEAMVEYDLPLLVHGEVTDPTVDVFAREAVFLQRVFIPLRARFPGLRVVLEHITTAAAVDYILTAKGRVGATITAHHLRHTRNDLFQGGIRPHFYCLPLLKKASDREVLLKAATSGNPRFFLGTDSAPQARHTKENACGCAGCYTAPCALELYAEAFESVGALDKLEGFASCYGADFYGLERNTSHITLIRRDWQVPSVLPFGSAEIIPFHSAQTLHWQIQ